MTDSFRLIVFCKDCARVHDSGIRPIEGERVMYFCTFLLDPVNGSAQSCGPLRVPGGLCDIQGRYWKEKKDD